jgi:tetratricopeptide (TPR) repeat protein
MACRRGGSNHPFRWLHPGWASGLSLLILMLLLPERLALAQEAGEIISVLGTVEVRREGRWRPVGPGAVLAVGETVKTGAGSRAAILLANGTQLKLNANSQLELRQVTPRPVGLTPAAARATLQNFLRVLSGEIWVRGGEPLEVQTVPATATIRGTEFNLAVGPGDTARLAVLAGLVEFSNPQGLVLVAANEQAEVAVGTVPRKTVLVEPLDAVQWSLYYPDLASRSQERARLRQDDPASAAYWTEAARRALLQGQVAEARQALDRALARDPQDALAYSLRATIELTQNRKERAREDAERAVAADLTSPEAQLSLSWVKQAEFDLDGALAAARRAVALDPAHVPALVQESTLLFGMGRLREAVAVAERARMLAPDDAMVHTVWGFLQLARNRVPEAHSAFREAITRDSTLALPRVGLGLILLRWNETDAAVAELRKATLLEPRVSLYQSYLGKAFYEVKQDAWAEQTLALAKALDPRDPTPWFYDAVRLQSVNQPVAAVENLQKSIELNDHRGVYRSRLLLDEDRAARSATLGRTYNELGFTQLALREGQQSVARDPTNYSARRLLADSHAATPNREVARASELLQAQLLQPLNAAPVSPQLAETKLLIPQGGPLTPSLYEFNPLFVREGLNLWASGVVGNQETWGNELLVSGLTERFSYSIGQFHYQSDGFRPNNDLQNDIYNLFVQTAVTPGFSLQAEYRRRETTSGDLRSRFSGRFRAFERRAIEQDMARVGARYALSPRTNVIASLIHADRSTALSFPNVNISFKGETKGYLGEAQLLHEAEPVNFIVGSGAYSVDSIFSGFAQPTITNHQIISYGYANIKIPENLIWTVGLSYESNEDVNAELHELNPKLGVQWAVNDHLLLRAAAFKVVKRNFAVDQTIQPTQVAGFNQFFDEVAMTVSKNYGLGVDVRFNDRLFGGLEAFRRDLDVPIGTLDVPEFYEIERDREIFYNAYVYWMPSQRWAVTGSWLYEHFEVKEGVLGQLFIPKPARLRTLSLPVHVQYFAPSGFFAGMGATYVNQHVQFLDPRSRAISPTQSEDFTVIDMGLGYRLPKRWGILSLETRNVFDKQFRFQDYGFQAGDQTTNPRFIPERTIFGRLVINF